MDNAAGIGTIVNPWNDANTTFARGGFVTASSLMIVHHSVRAQRSGNLWSISCDCVSF